MITVYPSLPGGPFEPSTPPPISRPPAPTRPPAAQPRPATLLTDLTEASRLAARAVDMIATLPVDDRGSDATKDLRIRIFNTSRAAQSRLERQFDSASSDAGTVSAMRQADAYLEDSNWQLAKQPSPDGRFTGVDVPGALRDAMQATELLAQLLQSMGGVPTRPAPAHPPVPPSFPPPGTDKPAPAPAPAPPVPTPLPAQPAPPVPVPSDPDYPGDDEFPKEGDLGGVGDS